MLLEPCVTMFYILEYKLFTMLDLYNNVICETSAKN